MKINNRLNRISEYHFVKIEQIKKELKNKGREIFDFSIGDPDLEVEARIKKQLVESMNHKGYNNYAPYDGINDLKFQIIEYYRKVFFVQLELNEVIVLIGSKEGLSNIIPAVCNINDSVIIPQPAYPVYKTCSTLWGCNVYGVPLIEKNNYMPLLENIPMKILQEAKLFFINYPNNPTGAQADEKFFESIVKLCSKNNIVLCNDSAYNEIIGKDESPISLLQFDEKKSCVEIGTFSKTYNMTGFRIGYAVGNSEVIRELAKVKSNMDSGQFLPIQQAATEALKLNRKYISSIRDIYDNRREAAKKILKEKNVHYYNANSTFYIWCKVPFGYTTDEFCDEILYENGIIVTPGYFFGGTSNGYFRIALTKDINTIKVGLNKLKIY